MAQFNEAQLKRMQLLAGATPEFMNFSHFVLESCLVRPRDLSLQSCDNPHIAPNSQFSICAEAAMDEWSWAPAPPVPESQRSHISSKSVKSGTSANR